jgi:hypothetical protein
MRTFRKDANEQIWLGIDWSQIVAPSRISGATWEVDAGITFAPQHSDSVTAAEFSGGEIGQQYRAQVRASTNDGETLERSFIVQVVDR